MKITCKCSMINMLVLTVSLTTMAADKVTMHGFLYDPGYYVKSFEKFEEFASKYGVQSNWYDSIFPNIIFGKLEPVKAKFGSTFRMLGVGSGSGETDLMMISHLLKLFPRIHNIVVEPTAYFVEKYRSLFKAKQHLIEGVETEWREQTLESFQNSVDSSVSYHFISAIHSLYHFEDYKATLRYMYDLLEEGGVLLIVMGAEDSGLTRLRKKVRQLESDYLIFHDAEHGAFHDHNAQHVCKAFDDMGIKYRCSRQRRRIQVTECLSADTEASNLMLDFLLQVSYFRKTAPPDSQKEILDYIESVDCCDPRGEDGELILNSDCDAVIVHKSAD